MNKVVIVTGAHGYVGSAVVRALREEGMTLALFVHTDAEQAALSGGNHAYAVALEDESAVARAVKDVEKTLGPVYALVNAAGRAPDRASTLRDDPKAVRLQFQVNAEAAENIMRACADVMAARGEGVIVGITTAALDSTDGGLSLGGYARAKHVLRAFLENLRTELAPQGVRVHEVAPGFMEGGMNQSLPQAFKDIVRAKAGTLTSADAVAEVISRLIREGGDARVRLAPEMES